MCDLKSAIEQLGGDASLPRIVSSTPRMLILNESKSLADQKNLLMSAAKNEIPNFAFRLMLLAGA